MKLHWLRNHSELKTSLHALLLVEGSGSCLSPLIPDGSQLFIDPHLEPHHGDFVLLRMPYQIPGTDLDTTVKQLQIETEPDGNKVALICNSAGRFRLVDEKIEGVVVAYVVIPGHKSALGAAVDAAHAQTVENIKRIQPEEAQVRAG